MTKHCAHLRRFQVSFLGKRRGESGVWCADCGQRLSGQGRLSPRKLKAFADMQAPLADGPAPDFDLE